MLQATAVHVYAVRPRKGKRGVDLISDRLPFGQLWHDEPNAISDAIGYATHRSRSHDAVIRVSAAAACGVELTAGEGHSVTRKIWRKKRR